MSDMRQFIASIENKTKKLVNAPISQPKKFVKKTQPVRESDNSQKVQAFVNVIGEVLYRHGLNEDKINEIISEIYGDKPVVENYQQYQQPQYQTSQYQQRQYQQPRQYQQAQRYPQPQRYGNQRDPVSEASRMLEGFDDSYAQNQYQGPSMPPPMPNSSLHTDVYRNLNAQESQGGTCYTPTLDVPYNPTGAILALPVPKELQAYMPNQVPSIPTNLVPMNSMSSNTVDIDYGSNLL